MTIITSKKEPLAQWCMLVIPAVRMLEQARGEFKANLRNLLSLFLKTKNKKGNVGQVVPQLIALK